MTAATVATAPAAVRPAIPAQPTRTQVADALATPWSDTALPRPRLPHPTGYPSVSLVDLARLR